MAKNVFDKGRMERNEVREVSRAETFQGLVDVLRNFALESTEGTRKTLEGMDLVAPAVHRSL